MDTFSRFSVIQHVFTGEDNFCGSTFTAPSLTNMLQSKMKEFFLRCIFFPFRVDPN